LSITGSYVADITFKDRSRSLIGNGTIPQFRISY